MGLQRDISPARHWHHLDHVFFCAANGTGSTSRGLKKQMLSTQPAPVGPYFWPFLIGWLAQPLSNAFSFLKSWQMIGGR